MGVVTQVGGSLRGEGGISQRNIEDFLEEQEVQNLFRLINLYTEAWRIKVKLENLEMGKISSLERTAVVSPVSTISPSKPSQFGTLLSTVPVSYMEFLSP